MQKNKDNIYITRNCVNREICDANIYYNLLFEWINGILVNKKFYEAFGGMFKYVQDALETKYIFALTKIFAKKNEEGLWKLLLQVKKAPKSSFELKLERSPSFIRERIRRQRKYFFKHYDSYVNKIQKIKSRLVALRNKQRAHNFPLMPDGPRVIWKETKEWLTFAEKCFFYAMTAICESSASPGQFIPEELNVQMRELASVIKDIKLYRHDA